MKQEPTTQKQYLLMEGIQKGGIPLAFALEAHSTDQSKIFDGGLITEGNGGKNNDAAEYIADENDNCIGITLADGIGLQPESGESAKITVNTISKGLRGIKFINGTTSEIKNTFIELYEKIKENMKHIQEKKVEKPHEQENPIPRFGTTVVSA